MDFAQLDLFARVARLGSLTKAAVALDSTTSAISRQLAMLEKEWGGLLFHRTGRGVTLTELGQKVLPKVESLLQEARELTQEVKGSAGMPSGDVRLGVLASHANTLLPLLYLQLREQFPGVRLCVFEGSTGQLDEWVVNGHVDIALVARQGKSFLLSEYPLASSHSYLVGAADALLTRKPSLDFDALHEVPLILPGLPNGMRHVLERTMRERKLTLNVVMEANSLLLQVAMVSKGCGYAILPRSALAEPLYAGSLSATEIVNPQLARTIMLTTTTQRPSTLAGRAVLRLIRTIVEGLTRDRKDIWMPVPDHEFNPAS